MSSKEIVVWLLLIPLIFIGLNLTLRSAQAQTCEYDPYPVVVCNEQSPSPYPYPVDTIDEPATSTPRPTSASTPVPQATFTPVDTDTPTPTRTPISATPTRIMGESVERRLYLPIIFIESNLVESDIAASVRLTGEQTSEQKMGRNLSIWLVIFMVVLSRVTFVTINGKKQRC